MNTTYILHGGNTKMDHPENTNFFRCFTQYVDKDEVHILFCYFAREKTEWETLYEQTTQKILENTTKSCTFTVAKDPEDLLRQLDSHDVLYVIGGEAENIEPHLPQLKTLGEKLKGKVYLGSSMGAFIVTENYILSFPRQEDKTVHHGLGLVPVSSLCHWNIEKDKSLKKEKLHTAAPQTPILLLDEARYTIFAM